MMCRISLRTMRRQKKGKNGAAGALTLKVKII